MASFPEAFYFHSVALVFLLLVCLSPLRFVPVKIAQVAPTPRNTKIFPLHLTSVPQTTPSCFPAPHQHKLLFSGAAAKYSSHIDVICQQHSWCPPSVLLTCILPSSPVDSILDATLTVLPHMSYCGFCAPTTPATTGPCDGQDRS